MLLGEVKPANQVLWRATLPSPKTILRSALGMTLVSIQGLCQMLHVVASILERTTAGVNLSRRKSSIGI